MKKNLIFHLANVGTYYLSNSFWNYVSENCEDHCSKVASPLPKRAALSQRQEGWHPEDGVGETDPSHRGRQTDDS